MNIIIKRCIKFIIIPTIIIALICFAFVSIDRTKKIDYDTSYDNALSYMEDVRLFFKNSNYSIKYDESSFSINKINNDEYRISSAYLMEDGNYIFFNIIYCRGKENFYIGYYSDIDEYGSGKSGIDLKFLMPILDIVCGYDFSEEDISEFIEYTLENNIKNCKDRYGYLIYDSDFINFWENWRMTYSVQEDNSITGSPHPKYDALFTIEGLTKNGTK